MSKKFSGAGSGRKAKKPGDAAIVQAPIVLEAGTEEGVKGLLDYIGALTSCNNVEVAAAENRRLHSYFHSMSAYLNRALDATAPESELGSDKQSLRALSRPRSLSRLFNAMAAVTNSTLISDVVIAPDDIGRTGPAKHLFEHRRAFNKPYPHCGRNFNMGFMQVFEGGDKNGAPSGTTFPVLLVDHDLLKALPKDEAAPLLAALKGIMTLVNHDMLHHFTSTYIAGHTVYKNPVTGEYSSEDPVRAWSRTIPDTSSGEAYETWAQMGQEKIVLQPESKAMVAGALRNVNRYMDGLVRARDALLAPGEQPETPETHAAKIQKAHDVVDYFGTVLLHGMTRVFPLTHPLMQHALARLEAADPAPEKALYECAWDLNGKPQADATRETMLQDIRKAATRESYSGLMSDLVQSYRELGCDVLPANDADVGYKHLKMLQLINLGGLHDHAPKIADAALTTIRQNMDDLTLRMVKAAAATAHFSVKAPARVAPAPTLQQMTA